MKKTVDRVPRCEVVAVGDYLLHAAISIEKRNVVRA